MALLCSCLLFPNGNVRAQSTLANNGTPFAFLQSGTYNFSTFTTYDQLPDSVWLAYNGVYAQGFPAGLMTNAPSAKSVELLARRTATSCYYILPDSPSVFYIVQSDIPLHYQKDGQWLTIDERLSPAGAGLYEAGRQKDPVGFDITQKQSYIRIGDNLIHFNNWQLYGFRKKEKVLLATADWSGFSAGDDGFYIKNIFPGMDATMLVGRGSIKTSFIIKENAFPEYERLLLSDFFTARVCGALSAAGEGAGFSIAGKKILRIGQAVMDGTNQAGSRPVILPYIIDSNRLQIGIQAQDINARLALGQQVIIDPLVSSMDSLSAGAITGSMNNGSPFNTCRYDLTVKTPAKATITDVAFQFGFNSYPPAVNNQGFFIIGTDTCNSGIIGAVADTNAVKSGYASTMGRWNSIPGLLSCMPAPACTPQPVNFSLYFYNTVSSASSGICSNQYIGPHEAFQILLTGHTLEMDSTSGVDGITVVPSSICSGNPAILYAAARYGVPPYSYTWSQSAGTANPAIVYPPATTTYTVTVQDQCGTTVVGNAPVEVTPTVEPLLTIANPAPVICNGTAVTYTASAENAGTAPVYQWMLNGNPVGANSSTYTDNAVMNGDQVNCILTSNATCAVPATVSSDTLYIATTMPLVPSVTITASDNNVCAGTPIAFTALAENAGATPVYQWQINGIPAGTNDSLFTTAALENDDEVRCLVNVSSNGCYTSPSVLSDPLAMQVKPVPVIDLTASNTVIARGDSAQITASITGGYTGFTWIPSGSLNDVSILHPAAYPDVTTAYQLNVTDTDGCVASKTLVIAVYDKIILPNAFAPDGFNKIFRIPPGISFDLTSFSIFNRYGQKVFETSDISQGWDGTFRGNPCETGAYVYLITGWNAKGKVLEKGTVLLVR